MMTMSAPSNVERSSRSQRGTPRKVTSGPNITPSRVKFLVAEVFGHLGEVVHVALHVLSRMLDRQRPVLLRARCHQHAAVGLVEPAQVRQRLVDLEVIPGVAHALGAIGDTTAGGQGWHVER